MFEKKKLNFWRLTFIFFGFILITLFMLWSAPQEPTAQMMSGTMGNMMKEMHVSNITIYDLLGNSQHQSQNSEPANHEHNQSEMLTKWNFLLTAIIFVLLPFIIVGTVFLAIVWFK